VFKTGFGFFEYAPPEAHLVYLLRMTGFVEKATEAVAVAQLAVLQSI
jgi:hypothetical protein